MSKPVILFYEPTPTPWGGKLRQYCALQGLRLCPVETSETGRTVAALAGGATPAGEVASGGPIPEPLLVFCHLTESQFNRLLAALRKEGAGNCLKAVLTPTNAGWPLSSLYRELCRERLGMGGLH